MVKGTTEFWDIETQVFVATALERFFLEVYTVVLIFLELLRHTIVLKHNILCEFRCSMTPQKFSFPNLVLSQEAVSLYKEKKGSISIVSTHDKIETLKDFRVTLSIFFLWSCLICPISALIYRWLYDADVSVMYLIIRTSCLFLSLDLCM